MEIAEFFSDTPSLDQIYHVTNNDGSTALIYSYPRGDKKEYSFGLIPTNAVYSQRAWSAEPTPSKDYNWYVIEFNTNTVILYQTYLNNRLEIDNKIQISRIERKQYPVVCYIFPDNSLDIYIQTAPDVYWLTEEEIKL